jgi:hypothetical protein
MNFSVRDPCITYVGIGSRNAPRNIVNTMYQLSVRFAELNYTLRTLNNSEVDKAFQDGSIAGNGDFSVHVPWIDSSQEKNPLHFPPTSDAFAHCDRMDPCFERYHPQTQAIKARLANLLFGLDTEIKADFIVCWSPDGAEDIHQLTKSTGEIHGVLELKPTFTMPVFNFAKPDAMKRLTLLISKLKSSPMIDREQLYDFAKELRTNKIVAQIAQSVPIKSITVSRQSAQHA